LCDAQLGDGTTTNQNTPAAVSGSSFIPLTILFEVCPCRSLVSNITFVLFKTDRIAGKIAVSAFVSFQIPATGKLIIGSKITLNYPEDFFAVSATPELSMNWGATGIAAIPTASAIVFTTGTVTINASMSVTITLNGLIMGPATNGSISGIAVSTSANPVATFPVPSGPIYSYFTMSPSDRIAGKTNVIVTLSFSPISVIPSGGTIVLTYPSDFFAPFVTPVVAPGASSINGLNITCGATNSTAVVLTTSGGIIGNVAAFSVTISGFTMGAATPGSNDISIQTSSDAHAPTYVSSGAIFEVAGSGGSVSISNQVANSASVTLIISFVPAPSFISTAFDFLRISGVRFSSLNSAEARALCTNVGPSNVTASAAFLSTFGELVLNLSTAATPISPTAAVICTVAGFVNSRAAVAAESVSISTFRDKYRPLQTQGGILFPEIVNLRIVSGITPSAHPTTAQMSVSVYGVRAGIFDWSGIVRVGASACLTSRWRSDTSVACRTASGVGFGWAVTASFPFKNSRGSLTGAFSYSALEFNVGSGSGLFATYYVSSSGLLNTSVSSGLTAGTRIPSSCTRFPHPSTGDNPSFFSNCLPSNPASTKSNNFVMRMAGFINIPFGGTWTFFTESNDGSRLWIGNTCVVDNNAIQTSMTERSGTYNFGETFGWYVITIELSQSTSGVGINVRWQASPLLSKAIIPASAFALTSSDLNAASLNVELPMSGAVHVTVRGTNFGFFGPSPSAKFGDTTCQPTVWTSSSSLASKASGRFSVVTLVAYVLTVAQFQSLSTRLNSITWFQNVSVADWRQYSNTPSTGSAHAMIFGRLLGSNISSARFRFAGTASQFTQWLSDSCIRLRTSNGIVQSNASIIVTFPGQNTTLTRVLSSALSYDTPSPSAATSQRLSNIIVSGSNFGTYLAVIPRTTRCTNFTIVSKYSSAFICNSSDLNIRDAGITVTEAEVSIAFTDTSRLDDVIVSLLSPQGKEYALMRSKCFGALPCGPMNSVAFKFQILPITQSSVSVPLVSCPSSGTYVPDSNDINSLRSVLSSYAVIGTWSLRVTTGSQIQNITSASLYFKTATLEFQIDNALVESLVWMSDSSVSMKAPSYQVVEGTDSSSGWGRNRSVIGLSSGIKSPSFTVFSYPDPILATTSGVDAYLSSGSARVQLTGRYFSNTDSLPRARVGRSICVATRWQSDTAVTCMQWPSIGSIRSLALSVEKSAVAITNVSFLCVTAQNGIVNSSSTSATTSASLITVAGAGFGLWDSSLRSRMTWSSSADATVWLSNTQISSRLLPFMRERLYVVISAAGVNGNLSAVSVPNAVIKISAFSRSNSTNTAITAEFMDQMTVASSGSNIVFVTGTNLGSGTDNSVCVKLSLTSCEYSNWFSDSIIKSKSPWGSRVYASTLVVSTDLNRGNSSNSFNFLSSNIQHLVIVNESKTVMYLNGTSMSPFKLQALVKIDEQTVALNWTSDSSLSFEHPWPVSKDAVSLFIRFFDTIPGDALLSTSTPANPVFVPSSKPVVDSLNVALYIPAPADVLQNVGGFVQRGSAMGWTFPAQNNSASPSYFESELIELDIAVYNNHTQVYLKNYAPVGVDLYSNVLLYNSANKLVNELICYGNSSLSKTTLLPPSAFATFFKATFALCSIPRDVASMSLYVVISVQARDELGALVDFPIRPATITIRARPQAVLANHFTKSVFVAGEVNAVSTIVTLGNTGVECSRLVSKHTANVSCLFDGIYVPVPFFPEGSCTDGRGVFAVLNQILRTCDLDLQGWIFGSSGSCQITIETLMFGSSITIPILVQAGNPEYMAIEGQLQSHIAEGGVIWSNNASVMKCLEISFRDKCNNTRNTGGFACKLSGFLFNMSQYALLGTTAIDAAANGRCVWCSARVSRAAPLVKLQVQWLQSQMFLLPFVNVSGAGEAAALSLVSSSITNQTKAGTKLNPVIFKLYDANGIPVVAGTSAVIRVRIIRKAASATPR
jgi:hypothetical protein